MYQNLNRKLKTLSDLIDSEYFISFRWSKRYISLEFFYLFLQLNWHTRAQIWKRTNPENRQISNLKRLTLMIFEQVQENFSQKLNEIFFLLFHHYNNFEEKSLKLCYEYFCSLRLNGQKHLLNLNFKFFSCFPFSSL